jgi:hypothetical protein
MVKSYWERDIESKADLKQLFFKDGQLTQKPPPEVTITAFNDKIYTCPFCLYQSSTGKFVISTKSGFHKGLGLCPECKNKSQWVTLHRRWRIRQFALFVYQYRLSGFWQKCKYERFNTRLRLIGQLDNFWNEYRRLKGDTEDDNETTQEYYECKQREEAIEQGYTVTENAT